MINEGYYVHEDVVKSLLIIQERYSELSQRTFKVVGHYPIAPSTLGPVSERIISDNEYMHKHESDQSLIISTVHHLHVDVRDFYL